MDKMFMNTMNFSGFSQTFTFLIKTKINKMLIDATITCIYYTVRTFMFIGMPTLIIVHIYRVCTYIGNQRISSAGRDAELTTRVCGRGRTAFKDNLLFEWESVKNLNSKKKKFNPFPPRGCIYLLNSSTYLLYTSILPSIT